MEVQGTLQVKTEVKTYGDNGFAKREIVLKTEGQYPQLIEIQLHQDNVSLADGLKKDELLKVAINIQGRKWTNPEGVDKYFTSLVGWRIEKVTAQVPTPVELNAETNNDNEPDDLPF